LFHDLTFFSDKILVMKIGYARVSTKDQNLNFQIDALKNYGCEMIFSEKQSAIKERPELLKMIEHLRKDDIVVVWKLDRLGRSLKDLVNLVEKFKEIGTEFVSIQDNVDTSNPQGRLFFNIMASLAEFEREIIRERTIAGLEAARKRGRVGGRPKGLTKESVLKAKAAKVFYEQDKLPVIEIQKKLNVSRATLYRYLHEVGADIGYGEKDIS
jgi:DNA invertase Pin-like site-specific DNA recombinase